MNPLQFGDKYILLDKIGSGGVAEVFRGKLTREQGFEKLLVIKKLLPEHNDDREMVDIFISEARLAALMQHDNIAAIYDFGEIDGEYFLAMEYLSGKNLHAVMARVRDHQESFTPAHALAVCSRICEGMEYAHSLRDLQNKPLNLVHRDLTPHNIFITYDGKVKILDFGVAKAELFDNKTREGVVKGKISYMSPERLTGEAVDSRADIFSIGILLYEMIGKARMYQGDTAELIRKCLTADFVNLRELAPNLDRRFYAILDKALAVDVDRRYRSCAEMQADIEDLLFDLQQRVDSKFLKTSIRQLFAREYEEEQRKIAVLWTGYDGAKPPASDGTDRFIRPRDENRDESDKTVLLRYQPALQLVKSKTREWHGRVRRMA
ncbi:MAG: serine/threonine protein kinase, partial [Desulfofustis sp.]|nr:serine/threonine protein kinase [Desulfofustis sp.]